MINFELEEKPDHAEEFHIVSIKQFNLTEETNCKGRIVFDYLMLDGYTYTVSYRMYKLYLDRLSDNFHEDTFDFEYTAKIPGEY